MIEVGKMIYVDDDVGRRLMVEICRDAFAAPESGGDVDGAYSIYIYITLFFGFLSGPGVKAKSRRR